MTDELKNAIEFFEERAAIMQFDGGLRRVNAESMALRETAERFGTAAAKGVDGWRKGEPHD